MANRQDRDVSSRSPALETMINRTDSPEFYRIGLSLVFGVFVFPVVFWLLGIPFNVFSMFCLSVIVILTGVFGVAMFTKYRLRQWLDEPRITTNAEILRRGETVTVQYRQMVKRAVQMQAFTATFVLRESATYRRGTDSVTVTHDHLLGSFNAPGAQLASGIEVSQEMQFEIPPNAIHTFDGGNNKLQYLVLMDMTLPEWPHHYKHRYEILVG